MDRISARNVLVHLLAPGASSYDIATRTHSLAPPPGRIVRNLSHLKTPRGADPLLLTGALKSDSPVWERFVELSGDSDAPLLIVATGFPNQRPAQRAAERLGERLGVAHISVVLDADSDEELHIDEPVRGVIVLARDQSLLQPAQLGALRTAWLSGTPLLLDGAAAPLPGVVFSAHAPTPEEAEAAELATQRSFLEGRTVLTDGLQLLNAAFEPQLLADNRWGRLFSLAYAYPKRVAFGFADGAALGAIGALAARLHALTGARVVAADLSSFRVTLAQQAGIEAFVPQGSLAEAFAQILPGGADVVVDATGALAVLPQAIEVAKPKPWDDSADPGARLVIQGSYPDAFSVPYQPAFRRELSLHVPRDAQPRDFRAVLDFMARGTLDVGGLISDVRSPEVAADTYAALAEPDAELITVAFQWHA